MGTKYIGLGTQRTAGGATRDHEQGSCTDFVRIWVRLQSTRQFLYGLWNRSETDFGLLSYGKETASRSILAVFVRKMGTGSISIMDGPGCGDLGDIWQVPSVAHLVAVCKFPWGYVRVIMHLIIFPFWAIIQSCN